MINARLIKSSPDGMKYIKKSVLVSFISLLFNIMATFAIGYLLQGLYEGTLTTREMLLSATLILASIVVRYIANIKGAEYSYYAATTIKSSLRNRLYQKLLSFGVGYNNKVSSSKVTQIASEGIEQIEVYFSLYLPQFIYSMLAPLTLFVILSFFSLKVSLILLICVPLIPLSIIMVNKVAKRLLAKYWGIYTGLGDSFLDNLQGLTTLKIYQDDGYKNKEMNKDAEHFRKITMKVLTMQLNSITLMDLIAYGGAAIGIIFALLEFRAGNLTLAQSIIFILLASEFFIPLRLLGSYFHIAMNGATAANEIFDILDMPSPKGGTKTIDLEKVDIEIRNLSFSYRQGGAGDNQNSARKILDDISMEIPNRSLISIVGESGCGKSTIASLLMGFETYQTGSILINGTELRDIDEALWMRAATIVKHKNYIFSGTIYDNLIMGNENATKEQLDDALKMVNLYDFVYEAGGLDFPLLEGGANLSGGQAQRLALARALLHDARVYIFDEASSNIDVESEAIIFKAINKLRANKTIILISHRLANVISSDKIYVLSGGKFVEAGTHEELLAQNGAYKKLFVSQQEMEQVFKKQRAGQRVSEQVEQDLASEILQEAGQELAQGGAHE